jgi:hypothetical protein
MVLLKPELKVPASRAARSKGRVFIGYSPDGRFAGEIQDIRSELEQLSQFTVPKSGVDHVIKSNIAE